MQNLDLFILVLNNFISVLQKQLMITFFLFVCIYRREGLAGSEVGELAGREQMLHGHDQTLVAQTQFRYWETLARLGIVGLKDLVTVTDLWILELVMGNRGV